MQKGARIYIGDEVVHVDGPFGGSCAISIGKRRSEEEKRGGVKWSTWNMVVEERQVGSCSADGGEPINQRVERPAKTKACDIQIAIMV